jgi:CO/xanthine dehydrogenase FAD-binding subunit
VSLTSVKEYFTPGDNEEVLKLLETYGDSALIVAGGSFVHGLDARDLLFGIEALIDIQNLGLNEITADSAGLSLGAMVTFTELQRVKEVQSSAALGAVRDALKYPPVQIRNVATVGGNIAAACPYFDLPTAIMALDGSVQAQGPGGSREIALEAFFSGLFQNTLEAGEFVTGLYLPRLPARSSSAFIKLETNANDLAIVNVAVRVTLDESGSCQVARVVIGGGVAETPVRAFASENLLQGEKLSDELLQRAGVAVQSDLQPMSDHRASAAYRSAMAKTLTERALRQAVARLD